MDNADKKASTHAGLIKDLDLRQFKNEIRMGQLENRITDTEQRVSADGRKLQTLERNGIANLGSNDPWYEMPALKNKKNAYVKKESTVSVMKSPKKTEKGGEGTLRESKESETFKGETNRKVTAQDEEFQGNGGGSQHMNQELLRDLIQEMIDDYKRQVNEARYL